MKILIDMNLSPQWVEFFDHAGFESVHWSMLGPPSAADAAIMDFPRDHGMVIFTHDLDFGALLARRKAPQPSVIQIRTQDVLPASVGDLVLRALRACLPQLSAGALVTIDPKRNRIRLLPIQL